MAMRMITQGTSKCKAGAFREDERVENRREGIDWLRYNLGGIDSNYQTDEQYLDELNRLGIIVTFEED